MSQDRFTLFEKVTTGKLMEAISKSMDDFLYIFDIQNSKLELSEAAVDRFMIPGRFLDDPLSAVYEEDREMLMKDLSEVAAGKEKTHDLHYRWLDKEGRPVWINCRGVVVDDDEGNPAYLVGCLNETGNQQRADNVTGLLGGSEFRTYLYSQKEPISAGFLMHIGVDDFSGINSSCGYDYGDHVLKRVADCMKECISDQQRLYRLVGDQYIIVDLQSHSMEDAAQLGKKISKKIYEFIVSEQYKAVFTVSAGAIDARFALEGYEECRRKIDFSLQYAKAMGKNSFYSFQQEDYNAFLRKEKIISALRRSIAEQYKGFNVYYQPIMDCATETITGAEALMRFTMDSEEGPEVISPIEFIPLLEETGLIIPAGKFVLKEAAKMCREIRRFIPGFQMNINVSYAQIAGENVEDDIIETIKEHALDPANICVEMTESRLIDMTIPFIRFRHKLKDSRIHFAIDDFGTGYSNLHCINDIKPDYIKIDRDFTAKAMNGQRDYELLKSIITMIHSVNAKICIEGIEQGEWRQEMEKMGADSLQGYFYGRPCNKSDFMSNYIRGAYICRS